jgi:hypothetical protein
MPDLFSIRYKAPILQNRIEGVIVSLKKLEAIHDRLLDEQIEILDFVEIPLGGLPFTDWCQYWEEISVALDSGDQNERMMKEHHQMLTDAVQSKLTGEF